MVKLVFARMAVLRAVIPEFVVMEELVVVVVVVVVVSNLNFVDFLVPSLVASVESSVAFVGLIVVAVAVVLVVVVDMVGFVDAVLDHFLVRG